MARTPSNGIAPKRIMNRIERILEKSLDEYSKVLFKRMANAFDETIDYFYNQYTPKNRGVGYYRGKAYKMAKRRYDLYNAVKGRKGSHASAIKDPQFPGIKKIKNGVEINIHISYHNMHKNYHRMDTESVFRRSYMEMKHGFNREENIKWNNVNIGNTRLSVFENHSGSSYAQGAGTATKHKTYIAWRTNESSKWWMPWADESDRYIRVPNGHIPPQGSYGRSVSEYSANITQYSNNPHTTHPGLDRVMYDKVNDIKKGLKNDREFDEILKRNFIKN